MAETKPAKKTAKEIEAERVEALLTEIAKLGGQGMKEEDVVYTGTKLVLPETWRGDIGMAIDFLKTKAKEEEEVSNFQRTYNFRPWDGARNAFLAMREAFGLVAGKTIKTFFGDIPPSYINVATGGRGNGRSTVGTIHGSTAREIDRIPIWSDEP